MIELSISSSRAVSMLVLMQALARHNVRARVVETMSTVAYRTGDDAPEEARIEPGFWLLITNVVAADFNERVWGPLTQLMPITCAHVRDGDCYNGCYSNWPGVAVATRCNERGIAGWTPPGDPLSPKGGIDVDGSVDKWPGSPQVTTAGATAGAVAAYSRDQTSWLRTNASTSAASSASG